MKIVINARRWFQKTYGNTYHSVQVYVNGKFLDKVDFAYGYGDQYLSTAHGLLLKHKIFKKTGERLSSGMDKDFYDFMMW
jgi:hypothetical protein